MKLADNLPIDLTVLLETRLLVQANSGGGKSWALRRLLEQTAPHVQQLVIDSEGEFATLREKFDYVIAAPHDADAIATPKTAAVLAKRLLEAGVSAILDIYDLKATERQIFVQRFLDALVNAPRALWHPVLVVIDEAHVFCPQNGSAEAAGAVRDIATRGRKRGLCAVLATQRLSKLHKDAAAECGNKLIGRTGLDVDVKRAADELGMNAREAIETLRSLEPGEFFAFGPALARVVTRARIGSVVTRHPKAGDRLMQAPPAASKKLLASLAKLADLQKDADHEARTIEELQVENARLKREARKPAASAADPGAIQRAVDKAVAIERKNGDVARSETIKASEAKAKRLRVTLSKIANLISLSDLAGHDLEIELTPIPKREVTRAAPQARSTPERVDKPKAIAEGVTGPQQRILDVLAQLAFYGINSPEKPMIAAHAGTRPTSGGYFNNLGALRSAGLIEYPSAGLVALTDEGRAKANPPNEEMTLTELHESWYRIVSKPQADILRQLLDAYPDPIAKDHLADAVNVSRTSGGYFNNLGALRTLGAIEYPSPGKARATDILFPKGVG